MAIIESVCKYLETKGYQITSKVGSVNEHCIEIVTMSQHTDVRLYVEAKGQTSSKSETKRFGKEFNRNQKRDHIGKALLKSCEWTQQNEAAAIALPDDTVDRDLINFITTAIAHLGIAVFLVDESGAVRTVGNLPS